VDEKAFRKGHNNLTLVNNLERSRGAVCSRGAQAEQSGRVPGKADEGVDREHRCGSDEQVESVHRVGGGTSVGCGKEDRIQQVPCGAAFRRGSGPGASRGA
jgi:hypothetical protein